MDNSQEIQKLKTELNSVKSELNQSNSNQKSQLEIKLSNIESQIKNLTNQDNKSVIQQLQQEIKELKQKIEDSNKKPDEENEPNNKKEERLIYKYPLIGKDTGYYVFDNSFSPSRDQKVFYISQNHPQTKKLLSRGKLQENKQFIIRYGKIDKESSGKAVLTFNKDNQELEITEA